MSQRTLQELVSLQQYKKKVCEFKDVHICITTWYNQCHLMGLVISLKQLIKLNIIIIISTNILNLTRISIEYKTNLKNITACKHYYHISCHIEHLNYKKNAAMPLISLTYNRSPLQPQTSTCLVHMQFISILTIYRCKISSSHFPCISKSVMII